MTSKSFFKSKPSFFSRGIVIACFTHASAFGMEENPEDPHQQLIKTIWDCEPLQPLIDRGADLDRRDKNGCPPLQHALIGNIDAFRLLIRSGADVSAAARQPGMTLLHAAYRLACEHGGSVQVWVMRRLLEAGADFLNVECRWFSGRPEM